MSNQSSLSDRLWLGTAMWGWTIGKETAMALLDRWYEAGYRQVDTATNYPIDGVPEHFRLAENWLAEWIRAHGVRDLRIWIKVGSLTNERSPDHNLSEGFLLLALEHYRYLFGDNLDVFGVHWDNRAEREAVAESWRALQQARAEGLRLGLSGLRHPEVWAAVLAGQEGRCLVQVKHNPVQSDLERYAPLFPLAEFVAYGINAGGLKLDPSAYRPDSSWVVRTGKPDEPPIMEALRQMVQRWNADHPDRRVQSFSELGLCHALCHPRVGRAVLGPSSAAQLEDTLAQAGRMAQQAAWGPLFEKMRQTLASQ